MKDKGGSAWRGRFWAFAPVVFWIGVIFFLGGNAASSAHTSRFIGPLLHYLFPGMSEETIYQVHQFIRKLAHLTEYGILGLLGYRSLLLGSRFSIYLRYT